MLGHRPHYCQKISGDIRSHPFALFHTRAARHAGKFGGRLHNPYAPFIAFNHVTQTSSSTQLLGASGSASPAANYNPLNILKHTQPALTNHPQH
jgi:hypothetical protein